MFGSMFGSGTQLTVLYVVAIMAMLYFLMIRPQKKQMNLRKDMLSSLKNGDHVHTAGGINGYIRAIKGEVVYVEIADGLIIEMMKQAIAGIIDESIYEGTKEEIQDVDSNEETFETVEENTEDSSK